MSTNEFQEIPKVELVNFSFSPPGPMGWSAAEYETMLEDPETFLSQNKYRKAEPPTGDVELIELPIKTRKPQEAYIPERSETEMAAAAAVQEESPVAEAISYEEPAEIEEIKQDVIMNQQEEAADILSVSEPVIDNQMEEVLNTINTSMSLIEMFSALKKKEDFSSGLEPDDKQESRFRPKRKSKHRTSTRKNRVLFM